MDSIVIQSPETGPVNPAAPANPVIDRPVVETEKGLQFGAVDTNADRPEWLPEKFKSPAELAKAYSELEKKIGQPKQEAPAPPPTGDPTIPKPEGDQINGFQEFTDEFTKNGKLSDDSYKRLESRGIPRALVDSYISNHQAASENRMQAVEAQVVAAVGGPESYAQMAVWASKAFTADEISTFNNVMQSGDAKLMTFAVNGMKARYEAQAEPKLISARPSNETSGFRSMAEMTAAMRDPRYAKDPAYRADVAARMKSSKLFGVTQ